MVKSEMYQDIYKSIFNSNIYSIYLGVGGNELKRTIKEYADEEI